MVCACRGFDLTCWLTSSRNSKAESIVVVDPDLLVELWRCGARIALMKQIQRQIQRPERERERNKFRPALITQRATDCLRTKFTCIHVSLTLTGLRAHSFSTLPFCCVYCLDNSSRDQRSACNLEVVFPNVHRPNSGGVRRSGMRGL